MHEATVCHLLRGDGDDQEILLGKRRSLFCNGLWNGPGGKMRKTESSKSCLRREVREEIGVEIDLKTASHFASVDFHHPFAESHRLEWRVHFFRVTGWTGVPSPSEELDELTWFRIKQMPFGKMMGDQEVWLPMTLNGASSGRLLIAEIFYANPDLTVVEKGTFKFVSQ